MISPRFVGAIDSLLRGVLRRFLRSGRTDRGTQPGRLAGPNFDCGDGAGDGDRHDDQRRHHGRQFSRNCEVWLDAQLRADLYIAPRGPSAGNFSVAGRRSARHSSGRCRESTTWTSFMRLRFHYEGRQSNFGGVKRNLRRHGTLHFLTAIPRRFWRRSPAASASSFPSPSRTTVHVAPATRSISLSGIRVALTSPASISTIRATAASSSWTGRPAEVPAGPAPDQHGDLCEARRGCQKCAANWHPPRRLSVTIAPNAPCSGAGAVQVFDRTFAVTWALEKASP